MLAALSERYPGALVTSFGDSPALSMRLIGLIRAGVKTATCSALRDYAVEGDPVPRAGDLSIVLDHAGQPVLVIRTTEVVQQSFAQVTWDFARDEGEDDELAGWQAGHQAFFTRNGGWSPDMILVCERFELLEDLV